MIDKQLLGVAATLVTFVSYLPYCLSVMRGRTKPHVFSWVIWGVLTIIAFAIQMAKGAGAGAWNTGFSAAFCIIIAGLALRGGSRYISHSDRIMFVCALAAIPLWYATENPLWALLLVMLIDGIGFFLTLRKAYHKPHEEMAFAFLVYALAVAVSLFAIERYSFITIAYPVFVLAGNLAITLVIVARRRAFATRSSRA